MRVAPLLAFYAGCGGARPISAVAECAISAAIFHTVVIGLTLQAQADEVIE